MKVYVHGIPAHAAFPEGSESAEVKMAGLLKKSGVLDEDAANLMDAICEMFGDYYGAGLNIPFEDESLAFVLPARATKGGFPIIYES